MSTPPPQQPTDLDEAPQRLQKVLAAAGFGSRRQCEEYILAGRVTVDGREMRELGVAVHPYRQDVRLDGERIKRQRKLYFVVNKPPGYLCTNRDPTGRPRVIDLFEGETTRLFTVGRLDENSQGLLLVTNDGELANRLAHPRYQIPRSYRVQVAGDPTRETLAQLRQGMHFADGMFRIKGVRRVGQQGKSVFLEIVLAEGHNREIRRLLARVGHKVIRLERIRFGPLHLSRLPLGRYRPLKPTELSELRDMAFGNRDSSKKNAPRRTGRKQTGGRPGTKRTGPKPTGRKQAGQRQTEQKPTGRKQAGQRQTEQKPTGRKQTGKRQTEQKPTGRKQAGQRQTEQKPTGRKQAGQRQTEQKLTGRKQAGQRQTEQKPTGRKQTGQRQTEQKPTGRKQTGQRQTEQKPTGRKQAGQRQTEQKPTGRKQTGQRQTGQKQTGRKTVQRKRTSAKPIGRKKKDSKRTRKP